MKTITLISDWKYDSYYTASVKGAIYSKAPDVRVIDITHQVELYNISQAAHVLKNAFHNFPEQTVHIICIKSDYTAECSWIAVEYQNHFFIGADNGFFGLLCDMGGEKAVCLNDESKKSVSFPELEIFVPAAIKLINQKPFEQLGITRPQIRRSVQLLPVIDEKTILGHILFIDSYDNLITNITRDDFERARRHRKFIITVKRKSNRITKISNHYSQNPGGELFAIFNSSGLLELGIYAGQLASLLDVGLQDTVRVNFE